jgi:hypothetical protein
VYNMNIMLQQTSSLLLVMALTAQRQVAAFTPAPVKTVNFGCRHRGTSSKQTSATTLFLGDFFNFGPKDEKKEKEVEVEETKKEESPPQTNADYDDDDPVEKMFKFFFGAKEEAPMGMARFGRERFPEQYPATKTEWADPVQEDNTEVSTYIRPFLKNTNLESRPLRLVYDANKDGWNALKFHAKVDKGGPSVVLCKADNGVVCGGYNPKGWVGYGEARGSIAAFLFTTALGTPGTKLQKVGGPGLAQMDMPENGPSFGADSLVIPLGNTNSKNARSKLGSYYERFDDGTNSLFGSGVASTTLRDLKVYQGVWGEDEYIPFTDAEPFALY